MSGEAASLVSSRILLSQLSSVAWLSWFRAQNLQKATENYYEKNIIMLNWGFSVARFLLQTFPKICFPNQVFTGGFHPTPLSSPHPPPHTHVRKQCACIHGIFFTSAAEEFVGIHTAKWLLWLLLYLLRGAIQMPHLLELNRLKVQIESHDISLIKF